MRDIGDDHSDDGLLREESVIIIYEDTTDSKRMLSVNDPHYYASVQSIRIEIRQL